MSQPSAQAQPPPQPAGHRDMMFCHECQDEWYRDMHGLTCPECGSDFTEIIEEQNDPRDNEVADLPDLHELLEHARHRRESDDESMPDLDEIPPHLQQLVHQNPFAGHGHHDDPEEADISNLQFRQLGPGRYGVAVTGTMFRALEPGARGGPNATAGGHPGPGGGGALGPLAGLLTSIIGVSRGPQQVPGQPGSQNQGREGQDAPGTASGAHTTPGGARFAYTAGARLHPRDANNPGPHMEPVDELNNVLVGLMAAFGEPPAGHAHHHHHHDHTPMPMNPLMNLFAHMIPGNGQVGDAVYSQEALDRIITQLMEQNASSNAPPPAAQSDIENLPRKPVSIDMLGTEGRADCSICMEEVMVGEEVAFLPCTHWFHHPCIAAWLGEHNTCPHCRKGVSKPADQNSGNDRNNQGGNTGAGASYSMPGAFNSGGEGSQNPYSFTQQPPNNGAADANSHASGGASSNNNNGQGDSSSSSGLGDRIRRGLFGP